MQVVVRQISGLGNQLFQYAAGKYYASRHGAEMRMAIEPEQNAFSHGYPRPFLLSHFSITAPVAELTATEKRILATRRSLQPAVALLKRLRGIQVFREDIAQRYRFLQDLPLEKNVRMLYLAGYWQAHRIADDIGDTLRIDLQLKQTARGKNLTVLEQIAQSENPVSLHVRRGDYTLAIEGNIALPLEYYSRAITMMQERLHNPTFFVFSDDIEFTKANLPRDLRVVFVDHNDSASSHEDLRLMSSCHHHIIANSTFSWWGAWLNGRPDKIVMAPKYWHLKHDSYYPDLLPSDWILIAV
jgi:Glycosyl transferase family 11